MNNFYPFYNIKTKLNGGYKNIIGDYVGFYCPHCFTPIIIKTKIVLESKEDIYIVPKFYIKCENCNNYIDFDFYIDPNITNCIAQLNKKGYITRNCCEGHNYDIEHGGDAYIQFKSKIDTSKLIYPWYNRFKDYYIDKDNIKHKCTCIRCNINNSTLEERIDSLQKWIDLL